MIFARAFGRSHPKLPMEVNKITAATCARFAKLASCKSGTVGFIWKVLEYNVVRKNEQIYSINRSERFEMSTLLRRSCGQTFAGPGAVSNLPCKANRRAWMPVWWMHVHVLFICNYFSVRIRTYVHVYMEGQRVQRCYSRYVIQSNIACMHAT